MSNIFNNSHHKYAKFNQLVRTYVGVVSNMKIDVICENLSAKFEFQKSLKKAIQNRLNDMRGSIEMKFIYFFFALKRHL